ncbi:MAG: sigma-54 dependent transcriptional regulator [Steroidobacteraceae bacterium]
MRQRKVLVIEPDRRRALSWQSILRRLSYEPIVVADIGSINWPLPGRLDWLAVLMGAENTPTVAARITEHLREQDVVLPLICAADAAANAVTVNFAGTHMLPRLQLELPIQTPQLTSILKRCELLRSGGGPAQAYMPVGRSPPMAEVRRLIRQVATFDSNVLILGESGTGKEMVARHVHELSERAGSAFVPVNCGAIPADLLESELFGHEKGAFTGALCARQGRFEYADGGTIFLDEIGDMILTMQVKLLRVLQEGTFERIGSNHTVACNARIIAATHRDLEALIAEGRFREDLFYRLNVFPIVLPPLRERVDDIPLLVEHLLESNARVAARIQFTPAALAALTRYRWPGNVRELSNLLERLCILHPGATVGLEQLPAPYRATGHGIGVKAPSPVTLIGAQAQSAPYLPTDGLDLRDHLSTIELTLIRQALSESGGTVAEAARRLRMQRTTLVEKLKKYGLVAAETA